MTLGADDTRNHAKRPASASNGTVGTIRTPCEPAGANLDDAAPDEVVSLRQIEFPYVPFLSFSPFYLTVLTGSCGYVACDGGSHSGVDPTVHSISVRF
jgi:hypothetical protein